MKLLIDLSDNEIVQLTLAGEKIAVSHKFTSDMNLSERLVPEIQKFLKSQKVKLSEITEIISFRGPGHFSRTRTVVATANALAYGLNLKQAPVKPIYAKGPNISKPKKRI